MAKADHAYTKLEVFFSLHLFGWVERYLRQELLSDLDKMKAELQALRQKLNGARSARYAHIFKRDSPSTPISNRRSLRSKQLDWDRIQARKSRLEREERALNTSIKHSRQMIETASLRLAELRAKHKGERLGRRSQEFARRIWDADSYEDIKTCHSLLAAQMSCNAP